MYLKLDRKNIYKYSDFISYVMHYSNKHLYKTFQPRYSTIGAHTLQNYIKKKLRLIKH